MGAPQADFAKLDDVVVGIRSAVTNRRGIDWMRGALQRLRPGVRVLEASHSIGHYMDVCVRADACRKLIGFCVG